MCEKLLLDTLNNVLQLNTLLDWLKKPNFRPANFKYNCNQVECITFFLNSLHEISTRTSKLAQKPEENENSTPKRRSALVENLNNLNDSLENHMSPLYKQHPFPKRLPSPKTPQSICLGDFLTLKESKKKIQKNLNESAFNSCARRINPTNISQTKINTNFTQNKNSFTFNKSEGNVDFSNRSNLIEERSKVIFKKDTDISRTFTVTKVVGTKLGEEPVFNLVTFQEKLNILIDIYVFLLNNCFVVNLTSEIYFIVTVLLNQNDVNDTLQSPLGILNSVHNQVYFAARVLQKQSEFLHLLDKFTIRLLFANTRFLQFTKVDFTADFLKFYETRFERPVDNVQETNKSVYFKCETDNRNNFCTNVSFNNFRKQRDLFYEILQTWEKNHLLHDWNFMKMLGQKIRYLINLDMEPNNLVHFAKLFKAQLLVNVYQDVTVGDEETIKSVIPNVDEEKLSKLNTRIGKKNCNGVNSPPIFSNYEEFYKDFLLIAANPSFNKHFIDAVAAEIVTINNFSFDFSDKDELDTFSDSIRKSFITKVKKLRILAKFLGFFESLPYRSNCAQLPENVITNQLEIRNKIQLTLNLKEILLDAVNKECLTLTTSWLVKYIAMLDCITMKMNQVQEIMEILFEIYLNGSNYPMIVRLNLGWLFELPHFPNGLYYTWLSNKYNYNEVSKLPKSLNGGVQLDDLDIFDNEILQICCPYLYEIKKTITVTANTSNRTSTFKHITPITAVDVVNQTPNKRLQDQLEEMFFSIQPDSVKRTVEFVSERVASGCIKEICYDIVPSYKKEVAVKLRLEVNIESEDITDHLRRYTDFCLANLHNIIKSRIETILNVRITAAMESLLSSTVLRETKELCISLTNRMCNKRVHQWVKSHVTQDIFTNNFDNEIKKLKQTKSKPQFVLPSFGKNNEHDTSSYSGIKIIEKIRELCCKLIEQHSVATTEIASILDCIQTSLSNRCDLNDCLALSISKLLLDFLLLVITHSPASLNVELIIKFCSVYKGCGNDDLAQKIISPRNIFIFSLCSVPQSSANLLSMLIDSLLESELLTRSSVEVQISNCVDQSSSTCLNEIVKKYKIQD